MVECVKSKNSQLLIYQSFLKMQIDIFTYKMVNSCQLSSKVQVLTDEGQFANAFLTRLPFLLWWSCEGHMHRLIRKGWVIFRCNEAIGMVIFDASTLPIVLSIVLLKKADSRIQCLKKSGHPKLLNPGMPRRFLVAIRDTACDWAAHFCQIEPLLPLLKYQKIRWTWLLTGDYCGEISVKQSLEKNISLIVSIYPAHHVHCLFKSHLEDKFLLHPLHCQDSFGSKQVGPLGFQYPSKPFIQLLLVHFAFDMKATRADAFIMLMLCIIIQKAVIHF